jgi:glycerol-3-phosphate dehydrogenase
MCGEAGAGGAAAAIERRPMDAAESRYDLIVVGGGIYGVALGLEAARRGYRSLLLERDDFGGATSWASLRIIHGGLRYLQSLDLPRFLESDGERRWFRRHFPDLVRPLPCLLPLYGRGLRRPAMLRLGMAVNDLVSASRDFGVRGGSGLPRGRILDPRETAALFPQVDRNGLIGAALWHDAVMSSSERLVIEMLRWACGCGSRALNYVEAETLVTEGGRVQAVDARDRVTGRRLRFHAARVVNATGPWSRIFARRADRDLPGLFRPALAFNLLLDRQPIAEVAVAVAAPRAGSRTYFVLPWNGRMLVGTFHAVAPAGAVEPAVSGEQVAQFLDDLNDAVPGLGLAARDVRHVYAGLLPARAEGDAEPATREVIHDHGAAGGPQGLYSVSGVKFTTARSVAEKALRLVFAQPGLQQTLHVERPGRLLDLSEQCRRSSRPLLDERRNAAGADLRGIVDDEAVIDLEDLLLRRTDSTAVVGDLEATARTLRDRLSGAGIIGVRGLERWPTGDDPSETDDRSVDFCETVDEPRT